VTLVDKIFAHARATPDRLALTYLDATYSYLALASRILQARAWFERHPVAGDQVAVIYTTDMARGWIVGLALRSLGVNTVAGRLPGDLEQLGLDVLSVVVIEPEPWPGLGEAAARAGCPLITVPNDVWDDNGAVPPEAMQRPAGAATGNHIVLTSATTGAYKKVVAESGYEAEEVLDRIVQFPELCGESVVNMFNFGLWTAIGYFVPMIVWRLGGRIVLDNRPEPWLSLAAGDVTMAYVQPEQLARLLSAPPEVQLRNDAMTLVVIAGVLSEAQWLAARERLTTDVRTTLGSSEAGCCGVTRIETAEHLTWHRLHRPEQVELIGEDQRPVPVGETGQVRVKMNRAASYLGDPEATRLFFRDGYFYPGDLAVMREDGRMALRGRVTDVINVLGSKYGTLPIEIALQARFQAEGVHVFSQQTQDGEEVHVVIQPGAPITAAELKAGLQATLPVVDHVRVHWVERFPRNNMGKIERSVLKAQLGLVGSAN
jgi:acyl-coenzyme A synthetase/AMP-(fatty) acid ligase